MGVMGQNRRYPGHNIAREVDRAVTRPRPIELSAEELDFDRNPVTEADTPVPATAWVRFHEATIHPEGEVIAWTSRAVKFRWRTGPTDHTYMTAWVWASAVDRR